MQGAISDVRDQNDCSADYAIATAQSLEILHFQRKGDLQGRSAQQIIDCSKNFNNRGCNGGNVLSSWDYLLTQHLMPEELYPWTGDDQGCQWKHSS